MALNEWFEKLDVNIILKKISEKTVGALLLLFIGLFLLLLTCNRTDGENCVHQVQALNDSLRAFEAREKVFYRNLYFERSENKILKDSLTKYEFLENFNTESGQKQIIIEAKKGRAK